MQELRSIGASGWASLVAARAPRHARAVRNWASAAAPLNAPAAPCRTCCNNREHPPIRMRAGSDDRSLDCC